jgi:protein-L-isoaspartate(D-aspartate) O-methyltransferase
VVSSSDDPDARLRAEMVAHLTEHGALSNPRVAAVLGQVPRHVFVPGVDLAEAYADRAIATHYREGLATSSASQPAIVAVMLEQLDPPARGSILEIGAGTGYNAALLSELVGPWGRVVTVDIDPEAAGEARDHLAAAGITNVEVICGDGALGWSGNAPYDGIIVTAGASDIAPAWVEQLATHGRLVVPLSIRGLQQCVAFAHADGHLRSAAVSECGFMPLTGAMANTDTVQPVPGRPGVYVQVAADTHVNTGLVNAALSDPGPRADIGVTASALEVFGSLRRWLAYREPAAAWLTYIGPQEGADASGVPPVLDVHDGDRVHRSSPCILGQAGFAAIDVAGQVPVVGNSGLHAMIDLAVRRYGQAAQQATRLRELMLAWDAAARPGANRLRIAAYPSDCPVPDTGGSLYHARHATFVVSSQ